MIEWQMIKINHQRITHFISKKIYFLFIKQAIFFDPPAVILAITYKIDPDGKLYI